MKNLKIRYKLFISYAIVLFLLIVGTLISIINLISFGNQIETFYNGPFSVIENANTVNSNFEAMQKSVFRAISNSDLTIANAAIDEAKSAASSIQSLLPSIKEHFLGDPQIITRLESNLSELAPMREEVLKLAAENRNEEAAAYMEQNNIPVIKKAQVELQSLIQSSSNNGETMISQLKATLNIAILMLTILGIGSVIVSISFGIYISRGISVPVAEIENAARNLAIGNLSETDIKYVSRDELGTLAGYMKNAVDSLSSLIKDTSYVLGEMGNGNFNVRSKSEESYIGDFQSLMLGIRQINQRLSKTLYQINESSEQVAAGSDQVSSGAQALSQGATEQASSVEELAATINDISVQIKSNADHAHQASERAASVGQKAEESNSRMRDMLTAMSNISDSSNEIGKIIKTIEDIAFQTNILALNAAVEAARAGESGKGFAVVADEVRNLASKSAEASKNTASLIETSLQAVENGGMIADETAHFLEEVVAGIDDVSKTIADISTASQSQAESVKQVTLGVDQISSVVQTNSATAEESAAASEELSGQAQILKGLIEQFTLRDDINPNAAVKETPKPISTARQEYNSFHSGSGSKY